MARMLGMIKQPNILFLFPDQHRWDWLGCAGDLDLHTPNLDALAAGGTRFTRCYTPSPVCSPARACLATGRRYTRHSVANNGQNTPLDLPNYYRIIQDKGYQVSGVGKFDLHKPDRDWGLDGKNMLPEYGFTSGCDNEGKGDAISAYTNNGKQPKGPYMHYLKTQGQEVVDSYYNMWHNEGGEYRGLLYSDISPLDTDDYCDNWVGRNAITEINNFKQDKPWHLVVNFVGPHDPYDVLPEMAESTKDRRFPSAHANIKDDPEEIDRRRRYYAAMIENIDARVGEMIAAVEARGELENTIIVYSSDHGEMLGDHGRWAKGVALDPSVRVPLIVKGPGAKAGQVRDDLISMHDITALIIEAAGAELDEGMDSKSPWPALKGDSSQHRDYLSIGLQKWRLIVEESFKYTQFADGEDCLIDQSTDLLEDNNIAEQDVYKERIERYRDIIDAEVPFVKEPQSV